MNFTADLVAQELYNLETLKPKILRTYSSSREDLFNIDIWKMPEYSVIYKMLYESEDILNEYTKGKTTITDPEQVSHMKKGDLL